MSERASLWEFRRRMAALAFKVWCKTPRWLALRSCYLPFYGRVGWALDDLAYGHLRDEYRLVRGNLLDPLEGANCSLCGGTADNFHVSDDLWERVGLGHVQACFKCFRIAAWNVGIRPETAWQVSL